jgi:hypothetical protein
MPQRTIHHAEALAWLGEQGVIAGASFVTSLPDFSEFPKLSLDEWKVWFTDAAARVLLACPPDGVIIFYQRDQKQAGTWVDKGHLVQKAAERTGHAQLWHKIVCRARPGCATFGQPGFSHLLCFSQGVRAEVGLSTPDVLPLAGEQTWTRGMGLLACEVACRFILDQTQTRTVVDPFCGHGTVLAVANDLGLDAVGVELGRKRAERARELEVKDGVLVPRKRPGTATVGGLEDGAQPQRSGTSQG